MSFDTRLSAIRPSYVAPPLFPLLVVCGSPSDCDVGPYLKEGVYLIVLYRVRRVD